MLLMGWLQPVGDDDGVTDDDDDGDNGHNDEMERVGGTLDSDCP